MKLLAEIVLILTALVGFLLYSVAKDQVDGENWATAQPHHKIGTLRSLQVDRSGWWDDVTTLTMDNGTHIRVMGDFDVWKPGMPVTQPKSDPDGKQDGGNYYCLADQCRMTTNTLTE